MLAMLTSLCWKYRWPIIIISVLGRRKIFEWIGMHKINDPSNKYSIEKGVYHAIPGVATALAFAEYSRIYMHYNFNPYQFLSLTILFILTFMGGNSGQILSRLDRLEKDREDG